MVVNKSRFLKSVLGTGEIIRNVRLENVAGWTSAEVARLYRYINLVHEFLSSHQRFVSIVVTCV